MLTREAFENHLRASPERKPSTLAHYRDLATCFDRPLDTISRRDVEQCFVRLTRDAG